MPSTLTHYLFNKNFIADNKYKNIFLLAGQGADTFFFYGYNLLKRNKKKEIRQIGYDLHAIDPAKVYDEMLRYSYSKQGEEKSVLISFTRGFMYHYVLDRIVHPYIFYNTGFPYTVTKYRHGHTRLESIVDTLLMINYRDTHSTRSVLKAKDEEVKICSRMICEVVKKLFNNEYIEEDSYYKAYKDYRFVRLIVDSRFGVKKALFNVILRDNLINLISQPRKVKDDNEYDYLNLKHHEWLIPCNGIKKNDSILDLFTEAAKDAKIVDDLVKNYDEDSLTKIEKFTRNTNHDGRELDKFMIYYKDIWKK